MINKIGTFIQNHWQWMCGIICGAIVGIVSIAFTVGVQGTNLQRDVRSNTEAISDTKSKVEKNTICIESLRNGQATQQSQLARIEEGVSWIKRDLEKRSDP